MTQVKSLLTKAQLLLVLSFGICVGALALTPPGTVILNRASVFYEILNTEKTQQSISNATTVSVGRMYAFAVENSHRLNVAAGVVAQFPHRIVNQGNTEDRYQFLFESDEPSFASRALDTPIVFLDINRNGRVEANEPAIDQTELLAAGESVDVVVTSRVSSALQSGQSLAMPFSVASDKSDITRDVLDQVTVGSPGRLEISLNTEQSCGAPLFANDTVTHKIDVRNAGFGALDEATYIIDGRSDDGVIVELPLADHTRFQAVESIESDTVTGIPLLQLEGFASNEWISVTDTTDERVTAVGYFFAASELVDNQVASFTVQLTVSESTSSADSVLTTAFYDADSDRIADAVSNSTCNTFGRIGAAERGELRFIQPAPELLLSGSDPDFYADRNFVSADKFLLKRTETDPYSIPRDGMYLELKITDPEHTDIRRDSAGNRFVIVDVESELTGDLLRVVLLQTNDTLVYRSVAPVLLSTGVRSDGGSCPEYVNAASVSPRIDQHNPSCVLESTDDDRLLASFGSDTQRIVADVALVNREGVVFDSRSLAPVSGAVVQIRETFTGEVAVDNRTGVSYSFVTDKDGKYFLPRLGEETSYDLFVLPPSGYQFPSVVPPYKLTDYNVHGFSYGLNGVDGTSESGVYVGASLNAQGVIDIPLDRKSTTPMLAIDKVATQPVVDIGQSVFYTVTLRNSSDVALQDVVVKDTLPFGFRFVPGTVKLDGVAGAEPVRVENRLEFTVGSMDGAQTVELSYAARASAASIDGDGVNTAIAGALTVDRKKIDSLPATARVTVRRAGVFSDRAALFGKVYVDQNCDGLQNHKEWPIGGVRLYLQDGTYAITDADGLYSLYGLRPDQYVVKLDTHTLPKGLELKLLSVEQAADADSRFVDLSEGDFHRADFAAGCPASDVESIFAEIKQRNRSIDGIWNLERAERLNNTLLQSSRRADERRDAVGSADGDLSSGIVDAPEGFDAGSISPVADEPVAELETQPEEAQESKTAQNQIEAKNVVSSITQAQAKEGTWLWPRGDMSLNGRFMAVVRAGIDPVLTVNGKAVPSSHIGERMVNRREKAQVVAWYGVELSSGENTVEVKGTGPFGNERVLATGVFKRPSAGTRITLQAQALTVPADGGRSTLPVTINIVDDNGYPALGVYYVTLESSDGSWVEPDIQDKEPGRQIRIENGKRTVYYRSSGTAGEVTVRVSTGSFAEQLLINQVAASRPLLVSGFVQAGGYFATEQLGEFSASTDLGNLDETGRFETRAALFVTGTVKDHYNLTLSYDSDKSRSRQLLRDINPTLHYPIHGDASVRGFEAQSRGKLYVRVERDKSSLMWGDFLTDTGVDRRDLARLNRTLSGLNGLFDDGTNRVRVFAAEESNNNLVEEIPGNGSALLYRLQQYPIVANSETVELITRSRDNPDLILDTVRLSRFGDYSVDDELGYLSFASAIATLDADQNPVFIRISYDVEQNGQDYLVAGVRYDRTVSDKLTFGASITRDGDASQGRQLVGLYGDYKPGKRTRISVSLARSDSNRNGVGHAHSLTVDHRWSDKKSASTSFTHQWADDNFDNVGASVSAGRSETRVTHSHKVGKQSTLQLEANDSRAAANDESHLSIGATLETQLKDWQVRAGVRQIEQKSQGEEDSFVTSLLGLRRKFALWGKNGQADIEYEQDLGTATRKRIAAGARLALHKDVNGYSRYELSNSLLSAAGLAGDIESESFTLGVESKALESTRLYSEYRVRGAFESRDYETASGVRGDYEIQDGLRVSPHFEYIKRLGVADSDSVSASVGLTDVRNPNSRRLIRLETRRSSDTDHYGLRASVTSRLTTEWTGILADNFSRQVNQGSGTVQRHSLMAALARRPRYDNKHHMLFMYQLKQERGVSSGVDRTSHVLSTHQNLQVDSGTTFSGRVGFKHDSSEYELNRVTDFSMLADARLSFDLGRRLNFDTGVGALSTNGMSEFRYSMGMGFNYTLNKNLRLSVAYNLVGFKDKELDAQKYNAKGAHVGLQYKLDEDLFKWLK